ncbi:MAG: AraC family transcriptional regulator [Bacteroidota bacterium]
MRRPFRQTVIPKTGSSFLMLHQTFDSISSDDFWHFHPEFEIVYVPSGNGKRLIGSKISRYEDGDLVLLGPNIPHNTFYLGFESEQFEEYVIQFKGDALQQLIPQLQELSNIGQLLQLAQAGLFFSGATKHRIGQKIVNMSSLDPFPKLLQLFDVLQAMATSSDRQSLAIQKYLSVSANYARRVEQVYAFIQQHYSHRLQTRTVAQHLGMTENSFCRFFKSSTGKTFKQALAEVRIQQACNLMAQSDEAISSIALDCGFNSLSLFNRTFKKLLGERPSDYRKKLLQPIRAT